MYSVLENGKLNSMGSYRMKEWKEAFTEYMEQIDKSAVSKNI